MSLFSFLNSKNKDQAMPGQANDAPDAAALPKPVDIPRELFIEEAPSNAQPETRNTTAFAEAGIELIYNFLQADYETRGYNDALTNPDHSYRNDNILLIKYDLQILIQKVNTYYEDHLRELDFHIASRSRAGLVDLVEELNARKEMVYEHQNKVAEIRQESEKEAGMTQRIILSYQRGFMRGLAALTQSNVLNKKL
jgi:hypothetical protein